MRYFAIVGDLVGSRDLDDRAGVQLRFQDAILTLNATWSDHLVVPLKLTAGDEVQGLTRNPRPLIDIMVAVEDALHPVRLSWGLGEGGLSTRVTDDIALMDGPCFHRAREAIAVAKQHSKWLEVRGVREPHARVLAALVNLMSEIRSDWTSRQAEVVRATRGRAQNRVAEDLDVAASTISRTLTAAHYRPLLEAEDAARTLLDAIGSDS